jgi:hypothetical protein
MFTPAFRVITSDTGTHSTRPVDDRRTNRFRPGRRTSLSQKAAVMKSDRTKAHALQISQEQLLALVRVTLGGGRGGDTGRPDDDHPLPPGPWDPVIRIALEQTRFGPHAEPWRSAGGVGLALRNGHSSPLWKLIFDVIAARHPEIYDVIGGGGHSYGDEVALNPQPLPPRAAFLIAAARAVVRRAELLQEVADATTRDGSEQGIIIVVGYVRRFSDDWCGNGFKIRWPFPGPRPNWLGLVLEGADLLVIASEFEQAANDAFHADSRKAFADGAATFAAAGVARLQQSTGRIGDGGRLSGLTTAAAV